MLSGQRDGQGIDLVNEWSRMLWKCKEILFEKRNHTAHEIQSLMGSVWIYYNEGTKWDHWKSDIDVFKGLIPHQLVSTQACMILSTPIVKGGGHKTTSMHVKIYKTVLVREETVEWQHLDNLQGLLWIICKGRSYSKPNRFDMNHLSSWNMSKCRSRVTLYFLNL